MPMKPLPFHSAVKKPPPKPLRTEPGSPNFPLQNSTTNLTNFPSRETTRSPSPTSSSAMSGSDPGNPTWNGTSPSQNEKRNSLRRPSTPRSASSTFPRFSKTPRRPTSRRPGKSARLRTSHASLRSSTTSAKTFTRKPKSPWDSSIVPGAAHPSNPGSSPAKAPEKCTMA